MEFLQNLLSLIQDQILGMRWLNQGIGLLLEKLGLDVTSRWGGSVHFFLYDLSLIHIYLPALKGTGEVQRDVTDRRCDEPAHGKDSVPHDSAPDVSDRQHLDLADVIQSLSALTFI